MDDAPERALRSGDATKRTAARDGGFDFVCDCGAECRETDERCPGCDTPILAAAKPIAMFHGHPVVWVDELPELKTVPKKVLILAAPGAVDAELLEQLMSAGMEGEVVAIEDPPQWKMVRPEYSWRDLVDEEVKPAPPTPPISEISPTFPEARHGGPHMPTWFAEFIRSIFCPRPGRHAGGWHHHGITSDQRRRRRRRERVARDAHHRRLKPA